MFQSLGDRLQGVFDSLRGRGRLSEADVKAALREVRVALLEADVNLRVARDLVARVEAKAIGSETLQSLNPDQRVIAIVHQELVEVLGSRAVQPQLRNDGNLWMLVGLQGAGKTTTAGKLAYKYKAQGRRPLLVAADTQRAAAREQLRTLGAQIGVPVIEVADGEGPQAIQARIQSALSSDFRDLVIVDTAGRSQLDEALMNEIGDLAAVLHPSECLLVIDAMTGQQSLPVAESFDARVPVTGLILTKLDGDARGGAALSAREVTGKPIVFAGMSEKIDGLEPFHPDRIANRILGMGDVLTLIEKARALEGEGGEATPRSLKDFTLADLLVQMKQIKKMGSIGDLLSMIPGANKLMPAGAQVDERELGRVEAIISSMTEAERLQPRLLNASRRKRIAKGSGTTVQDVNRLIKQYDDMRALMKRFGKGGGRGFPGIGQGRR